MTRAYPRYRDSGVEWLGEVPSHWGIVPLKSMIQSFVGGSWGSEPGEDDEDAHCIRATDFDYRRLVADLGSAPVRSFAKRDVLRRSLHRGELVIATSASSTDRAVGAVVVFDGDQPALPTNFAAKMVPGDDVDTWYLAYLHNAINTMGVTRSLTNQVTIANLDTPAYLASHGPLPPLDEQRAIAAFLDRETETIDALVAKKRSLLERLAEYRTALITRTVTKGLDPSVAMKDSGVEWLGEVPSHWEVTRLKWSASRTVNGVWGDEPDGENDIPCVRVADFDRRGFRVHFVEPTLRAITPSQRAGRELRRGDLLLEKSGGGEKQMVGCVVLFDHDAAAVSSNFVARVSLDGGASPGFWTYLHAALYSGKLNYPAIKQTTGIQNLDSNAYFDTPAVFPPPVEQTAIAAFLDREATRIDGLSSRVGTAIERLQEYRAALITAAVTGNIDVRESTREYAAAK